MRYVPSPDQIAYLERIGVTDFCAGAPIRRRATPSGRTSKLARRPPRRKYSTPPKSPAKYPATPLRPASSDWLTRFLKFFF